MQCSSLDFIHQKTSPYIERDMRWIFERKMGHEKETTTKHSRKAIAWQMDNGSWPLYFTSWCYFKCWKLGVITQLFFTWAVLFTFHIALIRNPHLKEKKKKLKTCVDYGPQFMFLNTCTLSYITPKEPTLRYTQALTTKTSWFRVEHGIG